MPNGYQPSNRIQRLKQRAMAQPEDMFLPALRPYYYLEGWMAAGGDCLPIRNAKALANVIDNMPVLLFDEEIIVGESGDRQCDGMINFSADQNIDWLMSQADKSVLTQDQQKQYRQWLEAKPFQFMKLAPVPPMPEELSKAQEHGVISVWGTDLNHSIRDYQKVLQIGFEGILAEVDEAIANLKNEESNAPHRLANLQAFRILCQSLIILGERYAREAQAKASQADDPITKAEWQTIAEVCRQVPAKPARTFREAVQSLWFAHIVTTWEDGINANGIGRIDQFLYPYYEMDIKSGEITENEAKDILAALWCKLYRPYDVQQMMVGGTLANGEDATNKLSYLVLDVTEGLEFIRCFSARLHPNSPRAFVSRCVDLVTRGGGIPFFFNDKALIPALVSRGISPKDAWNYAAIGCIEITIPGMANPHAVSHWINLPKCLELALNDGKDLLDGAQIGPRTGDLTQHADMTAIWKAFSVQIEHFANLAVYGSNACELAHRGQYRLPYLSILTDDCITNGQDIIEGGARYNYHSSAAMGIPNAADSMAALDEAVVSGKHVSREAMHDALMSNFEGNEPLRQFLLHKVPKYGNDEPAPDQFAADITRFYCDLMAKHHTVSGDPFFCHLFTYTLMLPFGKMTGASPDGRRSGDPLAYSVSPVQGRDREGLTALMNSLAKLPHHLAAASSSAIVEVDPNLLNGPSREAFVDLLIKAIEAGVGQLQFNVVNADTLRAAQNEPDRYRNLCVRVSGFSQQFCLLDKEMQDHIIARTKHRY